MSSRSDLIGVISELNKLDIIPISIEKDIITARLKNMFYERYHLGKAYSLSREVDKFHIEVKSAEADPNILKGFYIERKFPNPGESLPERTITIYVNAALNDCWTRFTICKELAHLFDSDESSTKIPEDIASLVSALTAISPVGMSIKEDVKAEAFASVTALRLLVPLSILPKIKEAYKDRQLSEFEVAQAFMIPRIFVPTIMEDSFSTTWIGQ